MSAHDVPDLAYGDPPDGFDSPDGRTYSEPVTAAAPEQPGTAADPFGGHEFAYESRTDLFRCTRCHVYEVIARAEDGTIEPCKGQPPAGSGPIEVNAW